MAVADNLFIQLSIVILIAIGFSGLMRLLKQPMIIGYILTGIAVSPYFLNFFSSNNIATFGQIGVSLLLFMVGLNLNPHVIKELGKVSIITGITQLVFTAVVGYFIGIALGFSSIVALYIAVALTNSSTIIILKLLSDKSDLEKLYARIAVGFLIVQDVIAILILMVISSSGSGLSLTDMLTTTVLKGVGLLFLLFIVGVYILPKLVDRVAKSQEFLLLFSVGWCLILATFLLYLHFSMEIGALLAGITLSLSPYRYEISAKMKPLRDFFIILFFIILGSQMEFHTEIFPWTAVIIFSLFILVGNPLILMIVMGILGYTKRTGFLVGLTVAQVSEFTFIMVALGVKMGHVPSDVLSFVTVIGMITIAISTYMIMYSDFLYSIFEPILDVFERKNKKIDENKIKKKKEYDIILFGYNNMGYDLLCSFRKLKKKFIIIDYDPERISQLSKKGYDCMYGDAADPEVLAELNLGKAKLIISTIGDAQVNTILLTKAREQNKKTGIILVSQSIDEALQLYKGGATYIVLPHLVGGTYTSTLLAKYGLDAQKFVKEKVEHLKVLKERRKNKNILQFKRIYRELFVRRKK